MDERTHGSDDATVHRVAEREVRLAMERLDLADRTLNVYRATAFLTALGITVSHDETLEAADDDEPESTAGDVANLIEVQGWIRNRAPAMTVAQFRERRRLPTVHRRATA
ncbi:hypothetical protein [Cellulomonas sp. URHD0024]|uniref:hypothetical protein n=1 Tax=Cellulomonas sp. URHD0024 TaxID=1302620 RepID=UPI0003F94FB6|nr:hypothetical protein [Cellulomonas sp. URHD0024]